MNFICLDFETFYDRDYSLSKITTEEYIRDDRFEVIGVSIQDGDAEPVWCSGPLDRIKRFLDSWELDKHVVIAHNAAFDAAILNWRFDIRPKGIADTLSMARAIHGTEVGGSLAALAEHYELGVKGNEVVAALGKRRLDFTAEEMERYSSYCDNDVALTMGLFKKLIAHFPNSELKLIDLTIRMFTEPVLQLSSDVLTVHLEAIQKHKKTILGAYDKDALMSNPKFADLLRDLGVEPPTKISPTTGKETYAFSKTDEGLKDLLEHPNLDVQSVVAARLGTKSTIEETRTARFIGIAARGSMPVPLRYYAAHTGRWGGDDKVNLQNLPRVSPLKKAILAPEGYVLVDSDSSQIEARTLAWLAEQNDLVDAFERNEDVYRIMASSIYGKTPEEINKNERFVGKTTILGCGYGMGAEKFQAQLKAFLFDMPLEECQRIIKVYRETYGWIPTLWRQANVALEAMIGGNTSPLGRTDVLTVEGKDGIRLPNGLYLRYPNLRWITKGTKKEMVYDSKKGKTVIPTKIYGGKVVENVCQALARIVIGEQMLLVAKKYKVAMTVHDAITAVVPEHEEETGKQFVELCMRLRPSWALDLPLNCEAGSGKSYKV